MLLDRDGVINAMVVDSEHGTIDSPLHPSQLEILPSAREALPRLKQLGFDFAIVTNQPAAAKGKTTRVNLKTVHEKLLGELKAIGVNIVESKICFHQSEDECECRKPKPKMLLDVISNHPADEIWMVGDGITDVQAGVAARVKTIFLGPKKTDAFGIFVAKNFEPDLWLKDLREVADYFESLRSSEKR